MMKEQDVVRLLSWYEENRRDLPWRKSKDPYHIWISEVMLQQTRVEAVLGYYQRFLETLPTILDLALVDEAVLMKLWEGLGYYSRARNLKKCASFLVSQKRNSLPNRYEELLALPGIGPYTAGAISSIAFGLKHAAVDGNVLRVMSRVWMDERDITNPKVRKEYEELVTELMIEGKTREFTEGLMDLGATICLPNAVPLCDMCPWKDICKAHLAHKEVSFPVKKKKKERTILFKTIVLLVYDGKVYLHKRDMNGLLAGLHEFFVLDDFYDEEKFSNYLDSKKIRYESVLALGQKKHFFSHEEWRMVGYLVLLKRPFKNPSYFAVTFSELKSEIALPTVFQKYARCLLDDE